MADVLDEPPLQSREVAPIQASLGFERRQSKPPTCTDAPNHGSVRLHTYILTTRCLQIQASGLLHLDRTKPRTEGCVGGVPGFVQLAVRFRPNRAQVKAPDLGYGHATWYAKMWTYG